VVGQRIHFSVRPEKFRIEPENGTSDWENRFVGEVVNKIYLGNSMHYLIALSPSEQIAVFLKRESAARPPLAFSAGDKVLVSWHRNDSVILND
jgi:ABC-type Fe3+/spermidine/putrescine transport system ATPase subunit